MHYPLLALKLFLLLDDSPLNGFHHKDRRETQGATTGKTASRFVPFAFIHNKKKRRGMPRLYVECIVICVNYR
jgi:hypothetical protein